MSYFSNASGFFAVGKRYSLDIQIRCNDGSSYHLAIDDCHNIEEFVAQFDTHESTLRAVILANLRPLPGYEHRLPEIREKAWESKLYWLFDMHEYHFVERFAAIGELVHLLNIE